MPPGADDYMGLCFLIDEVKLAERFHDEFATPNDFQRDCDINKFFKMSPPANLESDSQSNASVNSLGLDEPCSRF